MRAFLPIVLATLAVVSGQNQEGHVAKTNSGQVKGALRLSRDGRLYDAFRGIPYGKANRFQAPVAPDSWQGVKDVSGPAPACIAWDPLKKAVTGQEDCLNLNVYTPKMPKDGETNVLMPVVVYLHPGRNNYFDSEMFDAKYWMDENVVLVVPNWRQSVFGFLNTNDMYARGNQGLRDQVQVLKWIKENIASFGGDKARVTIMGSASGGADAVIHTLSPQSKGLFSGVVSMGLSPLSRHSIVRNPVKEAKKLGSQVGCPIDSSQSLVMCLQGKDAKEILQKMTRPNKQLLVDDLEGEALFGPTIDNEIPEDAMIIPDHPIRLLGGGKIVSKVPLIIGGNEYDGGRRITAAMLKDKAVMDKVDKQWDELAPLLFMYKDVASDKDVVSSKIRKFYFEDKPITKEVFGNLSDIYMDRFMGFPAVVTAQLYSKAAPVYLYYFHHNPETPTMKFFGINENYGMGHLDDVQYLFKVKHDQLPYPEISKQSKEYELSRGVVKLFGSFAENGKPTKTWGEGKEWKKNEAGDVSNWYELGTETALKSPAPLKFQKRVGFWLDVFGKELAKENEVPEVDRF